MKKIKDFFKNNYKIFIVYILVILVMLIPLPYHIYAPGGIVNINKRINVDKSYTTKGSFNLSYVSEYDGKLLTVIIGLIRKDWDILSNKDIVLDNETIKDANKREKILLEEAYHNATLVAYKKAKKYVKIIDTKIYVEFLFEDSKTNLKVGDQIIAINNKKVKSVKQINEMIKQYKKGDRLKISVKNGAKEYQRTATIIDYKNKPIMGIAIATIYELETKPQINYKYDKDEYGSSGGLMTALNIYNLITKKDITKGKTIVGTGTISSKGKVGKIDGVKYKIKGASKKKIDLFIVPNDNLKEALKVKKDNNYKFKVIGVDTFDEAINYLKKH